MVSPDPKRVFIVYGRNNRAHEALKLFLRALKLDPLDFDEARNDLGGTPFVGEVIRAGFNQTQAIVVLFTPDEYAALRPSLYENGDSSEDQQRWQPRANVIFEAGMALALDERRTILVVLGNVPFPSDLHGRLFIRLNNSPEARGRLRDALIGAGCSVDRSTHDLYNTHLAGDLESCLQPPVLPEVLPLSPFRLPETPVDATRPSVRITSPMSEGRVPLLATFQGTAHYIPQNKKLWLLVVPDGTTGYYPQNGPIIVADDGNWIATAYIGLAEPTEVGKGFSVYATLADQEGSIPIRAYFSSGYQPLEPLPDGITLMCQIHVVRA